LPNPFEFDVLFDAIERAEATRDDPGREAEEEELARNGDDWQLGRHGRDLQYRRAGRSHPTPA